MISKLLRMRSANDCFDALNICQLQVNQENIISLTNMISNILISIQFS